MRVKMTKEVLNERLKFWSIRVIDYQKDYIKLNNGIEILSRYAVILFHTRIRKKLDLDKIYNIDSKVKNKYLNDLKINISKQGGRAVQQKYKTGEFIRKIGIIGQPSPTKGKPSNIIPWSKGKTKLDDKRLEKLSKDRKGHLNPMFGKPHSNEYKKKQSDKMKQLILAGIFTPNTKNSRTHWPISYHDKKFRSSWEAAWFYLNPTHQFELIRIPYRYNNKEKIYIVDFADITNKIIVEIKPKEHCSSKIFKAKQSAAIQWANNNNYQYKLISQDYFIENMNAIQNSDLPEIIKNKIRIIRH